MNYVWGLVQIFWCNYIESMYQNITAHKTYVNEVEHTCEQKLSDDLEVHVTFIIFTIYF